MAAGLVAFAIMFGMCSARLNFAIPWSALISLCVTLSVDPALPYSLIRVADAEDHRDRGRWSRARHKACCGAEPMVRIHLPPAVSLRTIGSRNTRSSLKPHLCIPDHLRQTVAPAADLSGGMIRQGWRFLRRKVV